MVARHGSFSSREAVHAGMLSFRENEERWSLVLMQALIRDIHRPYVRCELTTCGHEYKIFRESSDSSLTRRGSASILLRPSLVDLARTCDPREPMSCIDIVQRLRLGRRTEGVFSHRRPVVDD
jgi:hypothetical protein